MTEKIQWDTSVIKTLKATDTLTENGYYLCVDGIRNCPQHKPPATDEQLGDTVVKQLVSMENILNVDEEVKKIICGKTFAQIVGNCAKYLSNHKDLTKFANKHGCKSFSIKVTPRYGSFWGEIVVIIRGIGHDIVNSPAFQEELGNTLQNIISGVTSTNGRLVAFMGTVPQGLCFGVGLTALVSTACLVHGIYYNDNRTVILGSAFVTATAGAGIGASVGSVIPVVGTAVGGGIGFFVGLTSGAVLGIVATRNS